MSIEAVSHASVPPVPEDDSITLLTRAISEATAAKEWETVKALNESLREVLKKRGPISADHARKLSRSSASFQAVHALEHGHAAGPLLAAFAADPRFGSLRAYAAARGINRASLSGYARGRSPVPPSIDKMIRRDFPGLEWKWPGGISTRRMPALDRAVVRYLAGELDLKTAAQEAGLTTTKFLDVLDKRALSR